MNAFPSARPVCHPQTRDGINTYTVYSDRFTVTGVVSDAVIRISASTDYSISMDGELIAFGQFSDYENDRVYDEVSLAPIDEGEHIVLITVFSVGTDTSTVRKRPSELIYEIFSGDKTLVCSGEGTKAYPHPCFRQGEMERVSGQLGFTFAYDARKEDASVEAIPALVLEEERRYSPRPIEKLRVGEDLPAVSTYHAFCERPSSEGSLGARYLSAIETEDGEGELYRYDFGRETTGILSLSIDSPCEQELLIAWGEHLADGDVRAMIGGRNFTCSYFARKGKNEFVMPFLRFGLRYLSVKFAVKGTKIGYFGIRETLYPLPDALTLRCEDSVHNRISDVSLRTLLLCMHNHYEDCPWREQALYTMDSRNQMLCGYESFGETRFARASLKLIAASLRDDGMLELCSPAHVGITIPSFSAIFLTQVEEYTSFSGDLTLFREIRSCLLSIADAFLTRIDPDKGLIPNYGEEKYWNFYEWQDGLAGSINGSIPDDQITFDLPLNAMVSFGLRHLSSMLRLNGENEIADRYENARLRLNAACEAFYCPERVAYATYISRMTGEKYHFCELSCALVLYAELVPEEREEELRRSLTDGSLIPVTLSHSIFKYDALMKRPERYAGWVFEKIRSVYGRMLDLGATTFWETEEGQSAFGNAGSLCHAWSAIPLHFYRAWAEKLPASVTGLSGVSFIRIPMK